MGNEMERRKLGNSGLDVPVVGVGTWQTFDARNREAKDNARSVVDQALATGANFFDSSPMYGEAEQVLGMALEGRREQSLIATKVWARSVSEGQEQIRNSLAYYGGRIDLYQIHNLMSWREHLTELERLKESGKISAIGATHYSPSSFGELQEVMKTGRITAVQIPYNPAEREVERSVLPLAADLGLGVVIMRPFGAGALFSRQPSRPQLARLEPFGVNTWAQALLKWILSDLRCHVAIPATSRPERMKENAGAGCAPWFGREERAYVAELFENLA